MRSSVIIPTLGRPEVLRRTLESVLRCDPLPDELIVVDGDDAGSARATTLEFAGRGSDVRYLQSERGLTRQRNRALDEATGDVIVFFDDDVQVESDVFAILRREFEDPTVLGVTGRVREPASGRIVKKHSPIRRFIPGGGAEGGFTRFGFPRRLIDVDTPRDISFMHGSFMSVRASEARAVRFDEALPGYGLAEDEDFSYRLSRRGRIRYAPDAAIFHEKTGHGTRDARRFGRQVVVNRTYLFRKNFDPSAFARVQFGTLILMLIVHRALNREWAECRGLIDGARAVLRGEHLVGTPTGRAQSPDATAVVPVTFLSSHSKLGGSELYLETVLRELGSDWIASVVTLEDGPLVDRLRRLDIDTDIVPTSGGGSALLRSAGVLRMSWRKRPPAVVHANGVKAATVAALATLGTRIPVVWAKHDFSLDGRLTRFVARRCKVVVGVSRAALEAVPRATKQRVVSMGIDFPEIDRAEARAELFDETGLEHDASVVGVVGRLNPIKGQMELIEIAATLADGVPGVRVAFIGGDDPSRPFRAELEKRAAELGVADRVLFLGHRDDALRLMAGFDVGVVPTGRTPTGGGREGFGIATLEFLGVGTPVVGYADGATPEVVGECGRLVPSGDRNALARAITALLEDPDERTRRGRCGAQRARREYTLENMVRAMKETYLAEARRR